MDINKAREIVTKWKDSHVRPSKFELGLIEEAKAKGFIEIPLTQGKVAIVDAEYAFLKQWKWQFCSRYARKVMGSIDPITGKRPVVNLHHAIVGYPLNGLQVDHINKNPLDNRKSNLRFVTNRQNGQNRSDSKLVGVSTQNNKTFYSYIRIKGKRVHLGVFKSAKEAHERYLKKARELEKTNE